MKIIAGRFHGHTLKTPSSGDIRPTSNRIKENMFNLLSARVDIAHLEVLDLFAGTGNLGLEALSRGADRATFVEKAKRSIRILRENINRLAVSDICNVIQKPVELYLLKADHSYDIIFSDPPYDYQRIDFFMQLVKNVARAGALWILEHRTDTILPGLPDWRQEAQRTYGGTAVSLFRFTGYKEE